MKKVCILLNKDSPGYSETFLQAHIDQLASCFVNVHKYLPNTLSGHRTFIDRYSILRFVREQRNNYGKFQLRRFLQRNHIEVVFAEYGHIGAMVADLCRELNLPLVVHFHGHDAYRKSLLARFGDAYKWMFKYASALIVVSNDMREQLIRLGADPKKIHLNVYGVNVQMFSLAAPIDAPANLLFIGRFVEKKAPYLTILAFQKIVAKVPGAKLIMVGSGELLEVCEKIVWAFHLQDTVVFKKEVPHKEVASLMQNTRAYVQHSLVPASGDSEGTPVTILEAGASGLPVISTQHAGIKDVVIQGETGFLVKEGDIDSMSEYMYTLLSDPSRAQEMGGKARKHISENYNMDKSIDKLKKIIDSV